MKVDMSSKAITNRLKQLEQLWVLSSKLVKAKKIERFDKTHSLKSKIQN